MRRNNPKTQEPFHRGDIRVDGYVFFAYTNKKKSCGYFKEIWLSPQASDRAKERDRRLKKQKYLGDSV
jgi:hypothetical protein